MRMSKPYAMLRLLQHGPLTVPQAVEITGWKENHTHRALDTLRRNGDVRAYHSPGVRRRMYGLSATARVQQA